MRYAMRHEKPIYSTLSSWLVLAVAASLVLSLGLGCQQEVVVGGGNSDDDNNSTVDNQDNANNEEEENQQNDHPYDDEYLETHGPDEDQEWHEAGSLQGTWRAAFTDGDVPLAYLDIFHNEGEETAFGDYAAGPAISDMQDGTTGELSAVTVDGDSLVIEYNPTTDEEEMYTLELTRQNGDSFTGEFSAQRYPETHEVSFERQEFEAPE